MLSTVWQCLKFFGFGPNYIKWVQLLYQAWVLRNGGIFQPLHLFRGMCHGCPLFPLLYALAAEPLAISIRSNPSIQGMCVGLFVKTIGMYADDILVPPCRPLYKSLNNLQNTPVLKLIGTSLKCFPLTVFHPWWNRYLSPWQDLAHYRIWFSASWGHLGFISLWILNCYMSWSRLRPRYGPNFCWVSWVEST